MTAVSFDGSPPPHPLELGELEAADLDSARLRRHRREVLGDHLHRRARRGIRVHHQPEPPGGERLDVEEPHERGGVEGKIVNVASARAS